MEKLKFYFRNGFNKAFNVIGNIILFVACYYMFIDPSHKDMTEFDHGVGIVMIGIVILAHLLLIGEAILDWKNPLIRKQ